MVRVTAALPTHRRKGEQMANWCPKKRVMEKDGRAQFFIALLMVWGADFCWTILLSS